MANTQKKYSRRTIAMFWGLLTIIVISLFIYFEQIAFLYVLATLAITALLLIVGAADLEHIKADGSDDFARKSE